MGERFALTRNQGAHHASVIATCIDRLIISGGFENACIFMRRNALIANDNLAFCQNQNGLILDEGGVKHMTFR